MYKQDQAGIGNTRSPISAFCETTGANLLCSYPERLMIGNQSLWSAFGAPPTRTANWSASETVTPPIGHSQVVELGGMLVHEEYEVLERTSLACTVAPGARPPSMLRANVTMAIRRGSPALSV